MGGLEPSSSTRSNHSSDGPSTPPPPPVSTTSTHSLPSYAPPVLGAELADYALACAGTYLRRVGPSTIEHLILRERTEELDRCQEMRIFERDTAVLHATHHIPVDDGLILDPLSSLKSSNEVSNSNGNNDDDGSHHHPLSKAPVMSFRVSMNGSSRVAPYVPSALTVGLYSVTGHSEILAYLAHLCVFLIMVSCGVVLTFKPLTR